MGKMQIISNIKVIFLAIIGIFAISSTNVHGNYEFLGKNGFLNHMYDDKERKVFEGLYEYMNTTQNKDRRSYIEENLLKEIEKIFSKGKSAPIYKITKRIFKFAFGEILSQIIPMFELSDKDALKLASIFLDVDSKEILEIAEESNARFMGCRELGYSFEDKVVRKLYGDRRFYFIRDNEDEDMGTDESMNEDINMSEESFDE